MAKPTKPGELQACLDARPPESMMIVATDGTRINKHCVWSYRVFSAEEIRLYLTNNQMVILKTPTKESQVKKLKQLDDFFGVLV